MTDSDSIVFSSLPFVRREPVKLYIARTPQLENRLHVSLLCLEDEGGLEVGPETEDSDRFFLSMGFQHWLIKQEIVKSLLRKFERRLSLNPGRTLEDIFLSLDKAFAICGQELDPVLKGVSTDFDFDAIQLVDQVLGDGVFQICGKAIQKIEYISHSFDSLPYEKRLSTYSMVFKTEDGQYLVDIGCTSDYFQETMNSIKNPKCPILETKETNWEKRFLGEFEQFHNIYFLMKSKWSVPVGFVPATDSTVIFIPKFA